MTIRRKRRNKKMLLLKFGFVFYFAICLFALIWLRAAVVSLEYEIGDIEKQRADLLREKKIVIARRASYISTSKIEKAALKKLGMTLPNRENVFFVKKEMTAAPYRASMR